MIRITTTSDQIVDINPAHVLAVEHGAVDDDPRIVTIVMARGGKFYEITFADFDADVAPNLP